VIAMKKAVSQSMILLSSIAMTSSAVAEEGYKPPPMGVLCMTAMIGFSVEAGKQCLPEYNVEGQIRLQKSLDHLESYLLNSDGWDRAKVGDFMRKQGKRGQIAQVQCKELDDVDYLKLAKAVIDADADERDLDIAEMTRIKREPMWGDCL
jgi:hypothetical protein